MFTRIGALSRLLSLVAFGTLACSNTEEPSEDHTPTSFIVVINGGQATQPYTFIQGTTVRVQLKFFNAANEDLDEVEASHFAGLTFAPAALATVVPVSGHHFQFDVTGENVGTGTVTIGYGHDEAADEHSFAGLNVAVVV